ncbi:tRNA pseudouridine(65) synthase TruC [Sulfurimonas sp.]|uniref:tRNA pseudouridine(65) synthase TruC n=1 Tax=Sulfurimonas sp. TaxID=2022749 RepID=UPI0035619A57
MNINEELEIIYQDEHYIAINKPSGLLVHRSPIDRHETRFAVQMLRDQIGQYVYPLHRLDKPTSGVLFFALDKESANLVSEQFKNNAIQKTYIAAVRGYTDDEGVIDYALKEKLDKIADKDAKTDKDAQEAVTHYKTLARAELDFAVGRYDKVRYSLVELKPKTGRKHQIRRHMKHISHHLLGDTKYGRGEHNKLIRAEFNCHRMLLHASELKLYHPYLKKEIVIKAGLDETFSNICRSTFCYPDAR